MNPHIPLASVVLQSNTDATPVPTKHQAEMCCCKYCSKHGKRKGQAAPDHRDLRLPLLPLAHKLPREAPARRADA